MSASPLRLLFLSDTHLGFDLPQRPRVRRRRRGHDFFRNFELALAPALRGEVDLVVHGGDLLFRSKVPARLVDQALVPLKRVADAGVPVVMLPGNHERSHIPFRLLAQHRGLHVFDRPQTFHLLLGQLRVALAGFPYERGGVRDRFGALLDATGWQRGQADVRLLCLHHCVEGAQVGPRDFTFRHAPDVIRGHDLPRGLAAVLCGHVHRHQVLTHDLRRVPLAAPVLYAGSTERTSFAERDEPKGYLRIELEGDEASGGRLRSWRFCPLPARPMVQNDLDVEALAPGALEEAVRDAIAAAPVDAVLKLRLHGLGDEATLASLSAARLRALAPETMNVSMSVFPRVSEALEP